MSHITFGEWRKNLARDITKELGVSMNKIPDFPLESWWREGIKPRDAIEIIRDEIGELSVFDEDPLDHYA